MFLHKIYNIEIISKQECYSDWIGWYLPGSWLLGTTVGGASGHAKIGSFRSQMIIIIMTILMTKNVVFLGCSLSVWSWCRSNRCSFIMGEREWWSQSIRFSSDKGFFSWWFIGEDISMGFMKITTYRMAYLIFRANRTKNPARGYML